MSRLAPFIKFLSTHPNLSFCFFLSLSFLFYWIALLYYSAVAHYIVLAFAFHTYISPPSRHFWSPNLLLFSHRMGVFVWVFFTCILRPNLTFWPCDSFQRRMRNYETRIWEDDAAIYQLLPGFTIYRPEIHWFRFMETRWATFADDPDNAVWATIMNALKTQRWSQFKFWEEVQGLDEFLRWKKKQARHGGMIWRFFSSPKEQTRDPPVWLEGRGMANLRILWETLEVRARTLTLVAQYTQVAENGIDSDKRALLIAKMCAEYLSVKRKMELFRSKGWSNWLRMSDTEIDEKLLITCNSLRYTEGVWEKLEEKEYRLAMMSTWRRKLHRVVDW